MQADERSHERLVERLEAAGHRVGPFPEDVAAAEALVKRLTQPQRDALLLWLAQWEPNALLAGYEDGLEIGALSRRSRKGRK